MIFNVGLREYSLQLSHRHNFKLRANDQIRQHFLQIRHQK